MFSGGEKGSRRTQRKPTWTHGHRSEIHTNSNRDQIRYPGSEAAILHHHVALGQCFPIQSSGSPQTGHIFGLILIFTHLKPIWILLDCSVLAKMWTIWRFLDGWIGKCGLDYGKAIRTFVVMLVSVLASSWTYSGLYILFNCWFWFQIKQERNLVNFSEWMPHAISKGNNKQSQKPDESQRVT